MKKREQIIPLFLFFVIVSSGFFFLSRSGTIGSITPLSFLLASLQKTTGRFFTTSSNAGDSLNRYDKLQKSVDVGNLEKDNAALRDQFEKGVLPSKNLLPSTVIGTPSFVPGISPPEYYVLDKGTESGVAAGQQVLYKNNLVGKIETAGPFTSRVTLLTNSTLRFTALTSETNALGVVKGEGEGKILLDNVVLSDTLKKGDLVLTKGDMTEDGQGVPPGIVLGKIISVQKKASAVFQTAKVQSLLDFGKLRTVFIFTGYKN